MAQIKLIKRTAKVTLDSVYEYNIRSVRCECTVYMIGMFYASILTDKLFQFKSSSELFKRPILGRLILEGQILEQTILEQTILETFVLECPIKNFYSLPYFYSYCSRYVIDHSLVVIHDWF